MQRIADRLEPVRFRLQGIFIRLLGNPAGRVWLFRNFVLGAFVAGIAFGWYGAVAEAAFLSAVLILPRWPGGRRHKLILLIAFAAGLALGSANGSPAPPLSGGTAAVEVELQGLPVRTGFGFRIDATVIQATYDEPAQNPLLPGDRIRIDNLPAGRRGTGRENSSGMPWEWVRGDRLQLTGEVRALHPRRNPGAFDPDQYLEHEGFRARLKPSDDSPAVHVAGGGLVPALDRFRLRAGHDLSRYGTGGALMSALVLGLRNEVGPVVTRQMNRQGLAHLLSISGVHFTLFAFWIVILIETALGLVPSVLLRFPARRIAVAASLPVLFLYMLLTGAQVGTVRAMIMFSTAAAGLIAGRGTHVLDGLLLAGAVMLAVQPELIQDLSFQLSFLSMLGISLTPLFRPEASSLAQLAGGTAVASVAATMLTAPLVVSTFHQLPVSGILTNSLLLPVIEGVLLPLGLASALVSVPSHGDLPDVLSGLLAPACDALGLLISGADHLFPAPLRLGAPSSGITAVYFASLGLAGFAVASGRVRNGSVLAAAALLLLVISCRIPSLDSSVVVLDGSRTPGAIVLNPDRPPVWIYPGSSAPPRNLLRTVDDILAHHGYFGEIVTAVPNLPPAASPAPLPPTLPENASAFPARFSYRDREFRTARPGEPLERYGLSGISQDGVQAGFTLAGTEPSVVIEWSTKSWKSGTLEAWNFPGAWVCLSADCRPPRDYVRSGLPLVVGGSSRNRTPGHALWTRSHGQIELFPTAAGVVVQPAFSRRRS